MIKFIRIIFNLHTYKVTYFLINYQAITFRLNICATSTIITCLSLFNSYYIWLYLVHGARLILKLHHLSQSQQLQIPHKTATSQLSPRRCRPSCREPLRSLRMCSLDPRQKNSEVCQTTREKFIQRATLSRLPLLPLCAFLEWLGPKHLVEGQGREMRERREGRIRRTGREPGGARHTLADCAKAKKIWRNGP